MAIARRAVTHKEGLGWILDSGAYSAWRQRKSVDPVQYCGFIRQYQHVFDYIVCLDTIPGEFGKVPSPRQVEEAAELSFQNFCFMRDELRGTITVDRLIPVYHQGEQLHHLERLIEAGATYIGISPTNGLPLPERMRWVREVMKIVPDHIKTHGFGITTRDPDECLFFSMDSTSWSMGAGYGYMLAPSARGWKWASITHLFDAEAENRIQDTVRRTREKVSGLPECLDAVLLKRSAYARAVWNMIVQRAAITPHRCYAPVLMDQVIPAMRFWAPEWFLASYWFLAGKGKLLESLIGPPPTEQEAIECLNVRKEYRATSKRRGKQAGPILPGLA